MKNPTIVERPTEREIVVRRTFDAPPHIVYAAWTQPELFQRWWTPPSSGIAFVSCDLDVRTGGTYRLAFSHPDLEQPMEFYGRYLEATPDSRLVWTNEEGADGPVSTVTFEERDGKTLLVLTELYPSRQALDDAIATGSSGTAGAPEQFELLDEVLAAVAGH